MRLLARFLDLLFPPRATERLVREAEPDALARSIDPKPAPIPGGSATALLSYRDPLAHAAIVEAKYHGNAKAAALLGEALADYLSERMLETAGFDTPTLMLVPVPLSKERHRERGYNQVERITAHTLARLGIPSSPHEALTRIRDTASQTKLSRAERLRNVAGAFAAHGTDPAADYVLIDDVLTTGATLAEAAKALRAAGARNVTVLALAHQA